MVAGVLPLNVYNGAGGAERASAPVGYAAPRIGELDVAAGPAVFEGLDAFGAFDDGFGTDYDGGSVARGAAVLGCDDAVYEHVERSGRMEPGAVLCDRDLETGTAV